MNKLIKVLTAGMLMLGLLVGIGAKTEAATVTKPIGSTFFKSALYGDYYKVQDYKGTTVNAKTTTSTTLTSYTGNTNFSYGTVNFVDYDEVAKVAYKTTTSTQAYKTASTTYKLTAKNSLGQTVNVKMPLSTVVTKVSSSWYKGSFKYTDYVKENGIWVKKTKTTTAYVPSSYVKSYTSYVWTKYNKKATGYFWTPVNNGITLAEYNKVTTGMTYNQVLSITGQKLTLTYSSEFDGWSYKSYDWEYERETETSYDYR